MTASQHVSLSKNMMILEGEFLALLVLSNKQHIIACPRSIATNRSSSSVWAVLLFLSLNSPGKSCHQTLNCSRQTWHLLLLFRIPSKWSRHLWKNWWWIAISNSTKAAILSWSGIYIYPSAQHPYYVESVFGSRCLGTRSRVKKAHWNSWRIWYSQITEEQHVWWIIGIMFRLRIIITRRRNRCIPQPCCLPSQAWYERKEAVQCCWEQNCCFVVARTTFCGL